MQGDNNLVTYRCENTPTQRCTALWSSGTSGRGGRDGSTSWQKDGNLVVYSQQGQSLYGG